MLLRANIYLAPQANSEAENVWFVCVIYIWNNTAAPLLNKSGIQTK